MLPMTLAEVAAATGGRLVDATGQERVDADVVVDSRLAAAGTLFVAVPGEYVDGHDYAAAAIAAGASGVLAARPTGVPTVVVGERAGGEGTAGVVVAALGRLARTVLGSAPGARVTAVTGSSGKTSTKDLLAQVLPVSGPTVASPGSYNNDLGLPLTVLALDATTRHLVLEMGSRGAGDIARLCVVAPPQTGVVLNIGLAHVGEFGSREQTAAAKGELVEALPATGVAVLNADDPLVAGMAARTAAQVLTFGLAEHGNGADLRAERVTLDDQGRGRFRLVSPSGAANVRLQLVGVHHVSNALAAAGAGLAAGLDVTQIAAGLNGARAMSRWRMEVHHRDDGVTVVNDAYNANPDSVGAALSALVQLGRGRRTWAVLGEMLELGPASSTEHAAIGRLAADIGTARLVVVGEGARAIERGASAHVAWAGESTFVPDVDAAVALLRRELRAGDVVLVKSSRDAGLRYLGETLVADVPATLSAPGAST